MQKKAAYIACEVLYLSSCIYMDKEYIPIEDVATSIDQELQFKGARSINYLRKVRPESYTYVIAAVEMLGDKIEDVIYSFFPK